MPFHYFDPDWRAGSFTCRDCSWSGATEAMSRELYDQLMEFSCPTCDDVLVVVSLPTLDEIRSAARSGSLEAVSELRSMGYTDDEVTEGRMKVPPDVQRIADAFAEYFETWAVRLPTSSLERLESGQLFQRGWLIQYGWGAFDGNRYLDFYARHRMTNDRHERIHENGRFEALEAMHDWIRYPPDPTQEEIAEADKRYAEHNQRVYANVVRKFGPIKPQEEG